MNDSPPSAPAQPSGQSNPHAEKLNSRDWSFLGYLAALVIVPLVVSVVWCLVLLNNDSNFSNFPSERIPLTPLQQPSATTNSGR